MKAKLTLLDKTTVEVPLDPQRVDGIELGMIGSMTAPGKGTVRTKVSSMTPELIEFEEIGPELVDEDVFGDPEQIPLVAHTLHVGAYEHETRPVKGLLERVHVIGLCSFDPENSGNPIKFATILPLENRAMCDQMIEEITRARDLAFPSEKPDG